MHQATLLQHGTSSRGLIKTDIYSEKAILSLADSGGVTSSDQPVSWQSQSNHYPHPVQTMREAPRLENVKNMSHSQINFLIKAVKDEIDEKNWQRLEPNWRKGLESSWLMSLLRKPSGEASNAACIKQVQAEFLMLFKSKSSDWCPNFVFFFTHQVHTDASVQESRATKGSRILHALDLPDIALVDFFLYQRAKSELAGFSLSQESFEMSQEGVSQTIAKEPLAMNGLLLKVRSHRQWLGRKLTFNSFFLN
jgi:hypothetical protein